MSMGSGLSALHAKRRRLRAWVKERAEASAEERGRWHLELGILEKLLGGPSGIEPAFAHLRRALELLPASARRARQRALFVLGLTHGDVLEPQAAVERFQGVVAEDQDSTLAKAARGYAETYREHFGLEGAQPG